MSRDWGFLTNHGRVLLCIAHDPDARLRDIAAELAITERTAYGIVTDLTDAGYVVKEKEGRRNRYEVQGHLPLRDAITRERTVGEVLSLLVKPMPRREKAGYRPALRPRLSQGRDGLFIDSHVLVDHAVPTKPADRCVPDGGPVEPADDETRPRPPRRRRRRSCP